MVSKVGRVTSAACCASHSRRLLGGSLHTTHKVVGSSLEQGAPSLGLQQRSPLHGTGVPLHLHMPLYVLQPPLPTKLCVPWLPVPHVPLQWLQLHPQPPYRGPRTLVLGV